MDRTAAGQPAVGHRAVVIGITGPIGCGKSTIAGWLADHGVAVVDADAVARAVAAHGEPAHDEILQRFGDEVRTPDGALDRVALARLVFDDTRALADLEAIVHPRVRPRIVAAIADAQARGAPGVVVEAIKLVESGLAGLCDEVWLVTCDPVAQRERILARGMTASDANGRLGTQAGLTDRLRAAATRVIDTSGSLEAARAAVDKAWRSAREVTATGRR
jgi:dephospho-CoA kinase